MKHANRNENNRVKADAVSYFKRTMKGDAPKIEDVKAYIRLKLGKKVPKWVVSSLAFQVINSRTLGLS